MLSSEESEGNSFVMVGVTGSVRQLDIPPSRGDWMRDRNAFVLLLLCCFVLDPTSGLEPAATMVKLRRVFICGKGFGLAGLRSGMNCVMFCVMFCVVFCDLFSSVCRIPDADAKQRQRWARGFDFGSLL